MSRFLLVGVGQTAFLAWVVNSLSAAESRVLIPNATEEGTIWRFTTDDPGNDWARPDFDDRNWTQGKAGFGVTDHVTPAATIGTAWTTSEIWLRKTIDVPGAVEFTKAGLIVRHDEDVDVFLNDTMIFSAGGFNTEWTDLCPKPNWRLSLGPGGRPHTDLYALGLETGRPCARSMAARRVSRRWQALRRSGIPAAAAIQPRL